MSEDFVYIDNLYRSRMTLLDLLDARGYDVEAYRRFSPAEAAAAAGNLAGLNFTVKKKDDESRICEVRYGNVSRQKMDTFVDNIPDDQSEKTEVIAMMTNELTDAHHSFALKYYTKMKEEPDETGKKQRRKLLVSFFCLTKIVVNPLHHVLVPKHEIVPQEEHKELLERLHAISKSKLPEIKFHRDPITRCIGAVPGDIIKITRPSASSGVSVLYRVCAP